MPVKIEKVRARSLAKRAGLLPGETLISLNGNPVSDVLDYRFYLTEERLAVEVQGADGETRTVSIQKGEYDDIGLEFETYLMDRQHTCTNKCVFCFVDQMPPAMRESLYFKDDDSRMSFLFGNYITLTNLSEAEIDRIIKMHISPVNVSVHSTDPELRTRLMLNPKAGTSLRYLEKLAQNGVAINAQVVLCPGLNDGPALERTLRDLAALGPAVKSIACVPVGLTKHRDGLPELRGYDEKSACETLEVIARFAEEQLECKGERLAYPADELFLMARKPLPNADYYGEFSQLENGVGLLALLKQEFEEALAEADDCKAMRHVTIATGVAAYETLTELANRANLRFPGLSVEVRRIENDLFGHTITVAGLLTGGDLIKQLGGCELGEEVLITASMLRHERDRFLDDLTPEDAARALGVPVRPVDNDGFALLDAMLGRK